MILGFDTETHLIRPGALTPKLVVGSFCFDAEVDPVLRLGTDAVDTFEALLADKDTTLTIHNAAFDAAVMVASRPSLLGPVFDAYEQGRIRCTKVREMMIHNAIYGLTDDNGPKVSFALGDIVFRRFGIDISESKKDPNAWRLRYHELDGVPLDQWPTEAVSYAKDDALWHLRVFQSQGKEDPRFLTDEVGQTKAAFVLHLMAVYGLLTEDEAVQELERMLTAHVQEANRKLADTGILKPKKVKDPVTGLIHMDWAKDTKKIKELVEAALGASTPRTDPSDKFPEGQVKTDEETLRATGHPDLLTLAEVGADAKVLSVWVPALKGLDKKGNQRGLRLPTGWLIQPTWNVLVASGRTSCYAPPLQQPPRKGNVRPCFVPRPGYWYCSVDYNFIELVTWAQTCLDLFGKSEMAVAINADTDPHCLLAAEIMRVTEGRNVTYEEVYAARKTWGKDPRQKAKAGNFGFPGGLGVETFLLYAKANYGVELAQDEGWSIKNAWKRRWSESEAYFAYFSRLQEKAFGNPFEVTLPRTGFVRGGCTFTSGCNCVDYETEVLTRRGWLRGTDLTLDDYILTKCAESGRLEWQRPDGVSHFPDYKGPVTVFESTRFSAVTTPDHRWLVQDSAGKNVCVLSRDISLWGDHSIHRTGELCEADASVSDDMLELAGWFLTDGTMDKTGTRVRVFQSKPANAARIQSLFDRLGAAYTVCHNRKMTVWGLTTRPRNGDGRGLAAWLRTSFPKRVLTPEFVASLSKRQAAHLMAVMLLGDGHVGEQTHFYTRSEASAKAFQMLCVLAGKASSVAWRDMTKYNGTKFESMPNTPRMTGVWVVSVYKRDKVQVRQHHASTSNGNGVWCPSVPNTYFVARRKGTVYITGNTMFQGLAARGAKEAMWDVAREAYLDPASDLYGCRPVLFLHDEIVLEVPAHRERAHAAAMRTVKVMETAMSRFTPDVKVRAEPALCARWYKNADPVWGKDGVLELWTPPPPPTPEQKSP